MNNMQSLNCVSVNVRGLNTDINLDILYILHENNT